VEEEEEDWEWLESLESGIPLMTYKTVTADSELELLQRVVSYLQSLDIMSKSEMPRSPLMNFDLSNSPDFKGMKLGPTKNSKWKAQLFFDGYIDMKNR
tara:strand:+ start:1570 stop:1863 length:294 start_codon:yes stop_codon:yes gene_type:complete